MPRTTAHEHFRRHRFVRMVFLDSGLNVLLGLLTLPAQYELHQYYATDHDFTEPDFDQYRSQQNARDPSLANKVGKHFKVLEDAFITASRAHGITDEQMQQAISVHNHRRLNEPPLLTKAGKPRKNKRHAVTIPIARPIDYTELARVFMALARYQIRERREKEEALAASSLSSDQPQTSGPTGSATTPADEEPELPAAAAA